MGKHGKTQNRGRVAAALFAGCLALLSVQQSPAQPPFGGGAGPGGAGPGGPGGGGPDGGGPGGGAPAVDGRGGYPANTMGEAIFQTDLATGSIMVIADEETNARIQQIIKMLDRPVAQVLIKVLFLEVTHSNDVDLGVEGSYIWNTGDENGLVDTTIAETLYGLAGETRGGFVRVLDQDFQATLHALAQVGKLEVLSRPSILARNNEEAIITVGQEVPFIRNSRVTTNGEIINTVEYEDIGIILQVTPHITSRGMVELHVAPEISTLTGETVPISNGVDAPVFAKRSAETSVVVPSGHTIVIGGLMENQNTETVRKVPFLGDIPLLGLLFKRTIKTKSKTELLIFLTPHVVSTANELDNLSKSEYKKTRVAPTVYKNEEIERFAGPIGENGDAVDAVRTDLDGLKKNK